MEMKADQLWRLVSTIIPELTSRDTEALMTVFRAIEHRQRVNAEQACAAEQARPAKRQRKLSVVGGQAG